MFVNTDESSPLTGAYKYHPLPLFFYPRQQLSSGIVVSGKKSCPSGGWAAGRHAFVSGLLFENHYTYVYEIRHIFGPYGLVVPFGGHIAIAYIVFP